MIDFLDRMDSFLVGDPSDRGLESWVVVNLQRILDSEDKLAIDLVNAVDVNLIRLHDEIIDLAEFHTALDSLVRAARIKNFKFVEVAVSDHDVIEATSDPLIPVRDRQFSYRFA